MNSINVRALGTRRCIHNVVGSNSTKVSTTVPSASLRLYLSEGPKPGSLNAFVNPLNDHRWNRVDQPRRIIGTFCSVNRAIAINGKMKYAAQKAMTRIGPIRPAPRGPDAAVGAARTAASSPNGVTSSVTGAGTVSFSIAQPFDGGTSRGPCRRPSR